MAEGGHVATGLTHEPDGGTGDLEAAGGADEEWGGGWMLLGVGLRCGGCGAGGAGGTERDMWTGLEWEGEREGGEEGCGGHCGEGWGMDHGLRDAGGGGREGVGEEEGRCRR